MDEGRVAKQENAERNDRHQEQKELHPWHFDGPLLASGVITALAIEFLWQLFRRGSVDARALVSVRCALWAVCSLDCAVLAALTSH